MVIFYWRVSSEEDYDWLEFYIDDVRQDRISGSSASWQLKSYNVEGEGKHAFKWRYIKDSGTSDGYDRGYVDYLQWTGDAEPEFSEWAEIKYTYDPSGRRITKDVDGVVTKYLYGRNSADPCAPAKRVANRNKQRNEYTVPRFPPNFRE